MKGSDRRVSVVIPTKNRRALLGRTLATVLAQQHVELEVIVVDDGSEDGTSGSLADWSDQRIRVVRNERSCGVAGARNRGIEHARFEWVAFLDDDDLWAPRKLVGQLDALAARPAAAWCLAGAVVVDESLRLLRCDLPPEEGDLAVTLLRRNAVPGGCSGVLAYRELVRRVGAFDERLSMMADWDLWIRLALAAPAAAAAEPLLCYVLHAGNMSHDGARSDRDLVALAQKHAVARREAGVSGTDPGTLRWIARNAAIAGHRADAARRFLKLAAVTRQPGMIRLAGRALLGPRVFSRGLRRNVRNLPAIQRDAALHTIEEIRELVARVGDAAGVRPTGGAAPDDRPFSR